MFHRLSIHWNAIFLLRIHTKEERSPNLHEVRQVQYSRCRIPVCNSCIDWHSFPPDNVLPRQGIQRQRHFHDSAASHQCQRIVASVQKRKESAGCLLHRPLFHHPPLHPPPDIPANSTCCVSLHSTRRWRLMAGSSCNHSHMHCSNTIVQTSHSAVHSTKGVYKTEVRIKIPQPQREKRAEEFKQQYIMDQE